MRGVRPQVVKPLVRWLLVAVSVPSLLGCAQNVVRVCLGGDQGAWTLLEAPPQEASQLRALAQSNLSQGSWDSRLRDFWASHPDGTLLLCRNRYTARDACTGERYHFTRAAAGWKVEGGPVSICLAQVEPNRVSKRPAQAVVSEPASPRMRGRSTRR